jgi:hypothetical protein
MIVWKSQQSSHQFFYDKLSMSNFIVHTLNYSGIFNLKKSEKGFKVSKFQFIANMMKIFLVFWFRGDVIKLFARNHVLKDTHVMFSSFTRLIFHFYFDLQAIHMIFTLIFQLKGCKKVERILNQTEIIRELVFLHVEDSKALYEDFKKVCRRNISCVVALTVVLNLFDALQMMQWTPISFFSYFLTIIPHLIKITLFCFVHVVLQFLIFCQKSLLNSSITNVDAVSLLRSNICNLKQNFVSTMNFALFEAIICFLEIIVLQVGTEHQ